MNEKYILSLDQGTTSSRAIVFNHKGETASLAQKEFSQYYPRPGWVEHNASEIWSSQVAVIAEAISKIGINGKDLAAIGIANQRETVVVWDRKTGKPVYNAIVWQDRRTSDYCRQLREEGWAYTIQNKTGLIIDAYFSGTKLKWILDNVEGIRKRAESGELAFGTVDSWLVWNLTSGDRHVTDVSNASRTMLYNIREMRWDEDLLKLMNIPRSILPDVTHSSGELGHTRSTIFAHAVPVGGIAGDQQAALFGQQCTEQGMAKNTYGTGCFLLMNTGNEPIRSENSLLATIGWQIGNKITYALEGSIFIAGAAVQWLRDELGIIKSAPEIEELANKADNNGGVYFVPALAGLGAPYWDQYARGTIMGLTRGTNRNHLARAALEGIAFQTMDVLEAMEADSGIRIKELHVDGGASANDLLMQFQSEVLGIPVVRPEQFETTALGAAYLAGLAVGYWDNLDELKDQWKKDKTYNPRLSKDTVLKYRRKWKKAVEKAKNWIDEEDGT
jgi:glycerol kinase